MAFSPSTLALLVQSFGGKHIRLWGYGTRDNRATVTGSGYITDAAAIDIRVGDLVLVAEWDASDVQTSAYTCRVASIVNNAATLVYDDNYLQEFSTLANFRAANISGSIETVRVNGALTAGDCPPITLVRKLSMPSHMGRFQSADGAWWEFARGMPIDLMAFEPTIDDSYTAGEVTLCENWAANRDLYDADSITIEEWLTPNSIAVKYWLETAALYGVKATAAPGLVRVFGTIVEPGAYNLDVEISAGHRFRSVPVSLATQTRPMINIDSNVGTPASRPSVMWKGGSFWADGLPYGDPTETTPWDHGSGGARGGCLGFTRYRKATLKDAYFKGGSGPFDPDGLFAEPGYVAGDQGVTFVSCKYVDMIRCVGENLPDALVYPRTNADMSEPDYEDAEGIINITDCWAINCYQGVYGKYSGGQVNVHNFTAIKCWNPVNLLADYVPQITNVDGVAVSEGGTGYQPYTGHVIGLRARQTYNRPVQVERAENFIVQGIDVVDWGRLPDGTANISTGRRYVPVIYITGSRNGVVSGVAARVRDWDGGITDKFSHNAAFLDGVTIESHDHTADDDPVGGGAAPSNTIASAAIKISDVTLWGTPVEVDELAYAGSSSGRVDYVSADVSSGDRKGIGTIVRLRGTSDRTVDISGCHAYDIHATGQAYVFNGTTEHWIDGMLVPSPQGDGYSAGKEFLYEPTIAAGVITIPTQRRVSPLVVSVETQGGGSSDDLDTASGGFDGQEVIFRRETNGHNVVLKDGTGNINTGIGDITLADAGHQARFTRRGNQLYLVSTNAGADGVYSRNLTISGGAITIDEDDPSPLVVRLSTQGAASTDDLDTINGGYTGQMIVLVRQTSGQDVTVKHGVDNINVNFTGVGADAVLDSAEKTLTLIKTDVGSWRAIATSDASLL
jgi:hypothetical protein